MYSNFNQSKNNKKKYLFIRAFLTLVNLLVIILTELDVLMSYFYTIFLFYIISLLLGFKKFLLLNYSVLSFYTTLALTLYWFQFYLIPGSYGFTGNYGGIGTDDSRFFAGVANSTDFIPIYAMRFIGMDHNFVHFLNFLYPFNIRHPLSIIIPNLIGITFIPFFTSQTIKAIVNNRRVGYISFFLSLFCPLTLSNGLILMRDGWTAFLLILGCYYLIKKNIWGYLISLAMLLYIRTGSGLLLVFMPVFYFSHLILSGSKWKKFTKISFLSSICLLALIYGLPLIQEYLALKGIVGFEREGFVESKIRKIDSS